MLDISLADDFHIKPITTSILWKSGILWYRAGMRFVKGGQEIFVY
jgi:hypothetical protein